MRNPQQLVAAGRAYQRLHLKATRLGLAMQPLCQAAERRDAELALGLEPAFGRALKGLVGGGWQAAMPFRLGHPRTAVPRSPRRPLEEVLERPA